MKPGTNFIRRNGSTLYPWAAIRRGDYFLIPGAPDARELCKVRGAAYYQGLRIRLRRFRHSVRVERSEA